MRDSSQSNFSIQALAGFPRQIRRAVAAMPETMLVWQPQPDTWSVQMVITHLLHCEPYFQRRLERIVREDNPDLPGFGPAEASPLADDSFSDLLQAFVHARKQTLEQIYTYSPGDWARPAVHQVQGQTTLKGQIQTIINHDLTHLGQIHDLCEAWRKQDQTTTADNPISG